MTFINTRIALHILVFPGKFGTAKDITVWTTQNKVPEMKAVPAPERCNPRAFVYCILNKREA